MKKIFLLLMVVIVLTTSSFAQTTFSDLPEGHWAKGAVEEMVKQGIISGYTDGTFRPNAELSKIHSLLLLARIAGLNDNATAASKYASTYSSTLSKYSTQYKTDVAYLLGTGVLNESDLDSLIGDDVVNKGLSREEMAMLVTKVLGKDKEATSKSLIILNFSDASEISAKMKPYVYYVHSQGYMNGIDSENFAPKMILTRAQAASVFQRIYKLVDIKPSNTTTPSTPAATSFVNGTITKIDTSLKSVWIKDGNGNTEEYSYDTKTEFYVNSTKKTSSIMAKNAKVSATLSNGEYITIMNISSGANVETTTVSGTISAFNTSKKTVTIKKGSKTYTYTYDTNTKFILDGKTSTYSKTLLKNKNVEATIEDETLIKTFSVTTVETLIGEITEVNKTKGYLLIEDEDGDEYIIMDEYLDKYDDDDEDYTFDDDTDFTYNGASYSYSKISTTSYLYKKGNYVKLTLSSTDYIKTLAVATSKSKLDSSSSSSDKTITGEITEADKSDGYIIIDDDYILMDEEIDNYEEGDEDYYFNSDDTDFYYNGATQKYKNAKSYIYKEGNYIRITLDGDEITKLEVASSESKLDSSSSSSTDISDGYVFGTITDLDEDYIDIEDDDGEEYTFEIGSDCVIIERSSDDPEGDLYVYNDEYDDILGEDDEVVIFVYKKTSSKYYTSLIILMD